AMGEAVRLDAGDVVDVAHQRRLIAHLARTVTRARAVRGAAVPRHADDADLDLGRLRLVDADMREAHEGGDAGKARQHVAGNRKEALLIGLVHERAMPDGSLLRSASGAIKGPSRHFTALAVV